MKRMASVLMVLSMISVGILSCGKSDEGVSLTGAGATFPYPLYQKWTAEFQKISNVRINYQSIGSGGGIKQISSQTVDFGATDGPMSDEQLQKAPRELLHIPTALGAVVPTYNVPNVADSLNFTGEILADVYLGKITKWNNPALKAVNQDVELPDKEIVVVHRSDGSGTTYIWVDYLCKVSEEWRRKVGKGTSVNWPVGIGGKGNEGVIAQVQQVPHSIGYVELIYALYNDVPYGAVRNSAGRFVKGSMESVTQAAATARMPADLRVSITDAPGEEAYPLSGFTWLLVYREQKDRVKGMALVKFLKWALAEGQQHAKPLHYAPLPKAVVELGEQMIKTITFQGKPLDG